MSLLKDLLGEDYSEKDTAAEIDAKIANKGIKLADLSKGGYVDKAKYSEMETKLNDLNAKYSAKLTDAEKLAETQKANELELSKYRYKDKLRNTIEDDATRNTIAELFATGKTDEAIEATNKYYSQKMEAQKSELEKAKLHSDPNPSNGGAGTDIITHAQFASMSLSERAKLAETNPEAYKQALNSK